MSCQPLLGDFYQNVYEPVPNKCADDMSVKEQCTSEGRTTEIFSLRFAANNFRGGGDGQHMVPGLSVYRDCQTKI
jgi:hypothetical protein